MYLLEFAEMTLHKTPVRVAAAMTPKSTLKKFDLKSSLARGVTWKVHTGKLQPFQMAELYGGHQVDVKEVRVKSRYAHSRSRSHEAPRTPH